MAEPREFPYPNFAFRVKIGNDDENAILAGFQEVSGLGAEVAMSEYRAGNSKENVPIKVMGLGKTADVTLKRGVIGATNLFDWLHAVRDGDRSKDQYFKSVTIKLMAEDRSTAILEWNLLNARPMKYTGPALNGKSSDVAIEEIVLSVENVQMKAA
jgi:phage tail-like protein